MLLPFGISSLRRQESLFGPVHAQGHPNLVDVDGRNRAVPCKTQSSHDDDNWNHENGNSEVDHDNLLSDGRNDGDGNAGGDDDGDD